MITSYNKPATYQPGGHKNRRPPQPSQTLPNEAMSIQEILSRYARGMPISNVTQRTPQYDPEADLDSMDLERLKTADLYEKEEFMSELSKKIIAKDEAASAAKAAAEAAAKEKLEAELKELEEFRKYKEQQATPPKT